MDNVIIVEQLSKSYGELKALDNFNLYVKRGEVVGILGSNGAGKTTAIECILGTKNPDSGDVSILNLNLVSNRKELFERVGVQFQEASYQDNIRVGELCEVTAALYRTSIDYRELLSQFDIVDKIKSPVKELSGGQKQRLFIILALIPSPDVVFLDELTTGLDPKARRDVWKILSKLKSSGLSIVLTSHFMDEVETLCDKIYILKKGITIFYGTVLDSIAKSPYEKFEDAYLWYSDGEVER